MKKKLIVTAALAGIVGTTVIAIAQPSGPAEPAVTLIPYEGTLQTNGVAASGYHDFRFAIYPDQAPGASAIWSELQTSVAVEDGRFAVVLGEGTGASGSLDAVWGHTDLYLGIEVCAREGTTPCTLIALSGRQRILPVPRATHATAAGSLGQIIAMSTAVPAPDPRFWLLCDGRPIPPTSRLGKFMVASGTANPLTPDLADDRFLMGSPTAPTVDGGTDRGGHNDGHGHAFALQTGNPNVGSPLASHTHGYARVGTNSEQIETDNQSTRTFVSGLSGQTTGGPSNVNHTHPVSGTVGVATADGDAPGSNLPRFQRVHYYMKVN